MLSSDDMVDLKRKTVIRKRNPAIFASLAGPLPNFLNQPPVHERDWPATAFWKAGRVDFPPYQNRIKTASVRAVWVVRRALTVHHRASDNDPEHLIKLCRGCHARVHRPKSLPYGATQLLAELWFERH